MLQYVESGRGPVLVLLHGFPFDRGMWQPQLDVLSATLRVIVPDLPGFGQSAMLPNWSIDSAAAAVEELLQTLVMNEPVALGGLSMGGYIALAFARQFPKRLSALLLADTKADADHAEARAGRAAMIETAQTGGSAAIADAMLPKVLGRTTQAEQPQVVSTVRSIMLRQPVPSIVSGLEALRDRPDATPGLKEIAVPTLVVVGTEDLITPLPNAEFLAKTIPNAKLVSIPKAGHMPNLESPALFNDAVSGFLK